MSSGGRPMLSTSPCNRQGLPFYIVTDTKCELLPRSFHPYLKSGGFVSVALSLGLPPVAVSDCLLPMLPGLSSCRSRRLVNNLTRLLYHKNNHFRKESGYGSPASELFLSCFNDCCKGSWFVYCKLAQNLTV